jgi:hypothetical protein
MNKKLALRKSDPARKYGVLLAGGIIGALTGVGAAYLLWQAREKQSHQWDSDLPIITGGSAVRLGMLLFGLLRQIGDLAKGE